ncbi:MAG: response regulator [Candidatus Helarchaeota archaeon]|nr:response regulator [Candidatus Helarchaeota archaeon]
MKSLLLVVEDNPDVLYNLKLTLEFTNYEVITAENGLDALDILSKLKNLPNLIVSDIMMPKMNGYDFFKAVSENPLWSTIPFIFLTARTSPKDIRFGKMLGVDDYIIKPFKEEDLLASIAGKITRNRKSKSINDKITELFTSLKIETTPSIAEEEEKRSVILIQMGWDDKLGPQLESFYPSEIQLPTSIETIGYQLFNGVASIYGQDKIYEAQGILLTIENIKSQGFIFFDSIKDDDARGRQRPIMLGVIAPRINYFESLRIKEVFQEVTSKIKQELDWEIRSYWEKISEILSTPVV